MFDCIVGYHVNAEACGVARFNARLADRLNVPVYGVFNEDWRHRRPLISVKFKEWLPQDIHQFKDAWLKGHPPHYSLFLHDLSGFFIERRMISGAEVVYCGNTEVSSKVRRTIREDVRELWCPSLIDTERTLPTGDIRVFSFGMAHKIQPVYYRRLKELLDKTGQSYCLLLSLAVHQGHRQDDSSLYLIERIFGDRVGYLGTLSDAAVCHFLSECHYLAAFFEGGVKANNTTVHTALACGTLVITNLGAHSPPSYRDSPAILDVESVQAISPNHDWEDTFSVSKNFTWGRLVKEMRDFGGG